MTILKTLSLVGAAGLLASALLHYLLAHPMM
jgi:hypothetical protein